MGKFGLKVIACLLGVSMLALQMNFAYAGEYSSDERAQARRIVRSYGNVINESENRQKTPTDLSHAQFLADAKIKLGDERSALEIAEYGIKIADSGDFEIGAGETSDLLKLQYIRILARKKLGVSLNETYNDFLEVYNKADKYLSKSTIDETFEYLETARQGLEALDSQLDEEALAADFAKHTQNKAINATANDKSSAGDRAGAIEQYSLAIANSPDAYIYYGFRASQKTWLGDNVGAIADAQKAIDLAGNAQTGWFHRIIARANFNEGKFEKALAEYDIALKTRPWDSNVRDFRFRSIKNLEFQRNPTFSAKYLGAIENYNKAKTAEAKDKAQLCKSSYDAMDDAIKVSPNAAMFYAMRALATTCLASPNFAAALQDAKKAYQLDNQSLANSFALSSVYNSQGWAGGYDGMQNALKYARLTDLWDAEYIGNPSYAKNIMVAINQGSPEDMARAAQAKANAEAKAQADELANIPTKSSIEWAVNNAKDKRIFYNNMQPERLYSPGYCNAWKSASEANIYLTSQLGKIREYAEKHNSGVADWVVDAFNSLDEKELGDQPEVCK